MLAAVELLLRHNCNVNQTDSTGNTALHALGNKVPGAVPSLPYSATRYRYRNAEYYSKVRVLAGSYKSAKAR